VPPDKAGITVYQLLTQTAGLQPYIDSAGDFDAMTRAEAIRRILVDSLRFAVNTREAYSNAGYTLLAAIVEEASGERFQDYVRRHVLEPAGLRHTWFWGEPAARAAPVAKGYVGAEQPSDPSAYPLTWASLGGAGILTDVGDLVRLCQALERGTLLPQGADRQMWEPARRKWALGWEVTQTDAGRLVMKGGASDFGFTSQLRRYPDVAGGLTIVVLLNSERRIEDFEHQKVGPEVSRIVLEGIRSPGVIRIL
jgi:CubicO group peptidase (beta-lactamase class C family)